MYADFAFYTNTYNGSLLTNNEFVVYEQKAGVFMDYYTRNKVAVAFADPTTPAYAITAIKMCACELAETYAAIELSKKQLIENGGEIQSESVGSHSRSFRSSAETQSYMNSRLADIVKMYLVNLGYLYRGGNVYSSCNHCI